MCIDAVPLPLAHPLVDACAVVGSSDLLRLHPMGEHIDTFASVWRVNQAPTVGFEREAGRHTAVRVLNHVTPDVWSGRLRAKPGEFAGTDGEYPRRTMCNASVCVGVDSTTDAETMLSVHPSIRRRLGAACRLSSSTSTGFVAAALALRACRSVHLFGFFPHCCKEGWLPTLRYKYYHTARSSWVCCASGREDMGSELSILTRHPRIHVHLAEPKRKTKQPHTRCAVVGAAHSTVEWGARIDAADRVYRVNHHAPASRADVRTLGDGTLRRLIRLENRNELCPPSRCIFLFKYADRKRYESTSRALLRRTGGILAAADDAFVARSLLFKAQFTSKPFDKVTLSGGLATTLLAYEECTQTEVFLMETRRNESCCVTGRPYTAAGAPPHRQRTACCDPSRETRDEEGAWDALRARGVVVHAPIV